MNSSGIKRGLAISAISALAVAGIPSIASADTVVQQINSADAVVLYSQSSTGGAASIAKDGTDELVRLAAGGGANITSVTFQYQLGTAAWQNIATVAAPNNDGLFTFDWNAGGLAGAGNLKLRAIQTGDATKSSAEKPVAVAGVTTAVNLKDGSALGVFQAPNGTNMVVIEGTTSATSGDVAVSVRDGAGASEGTAANAPVKVASGATTGTFKTALNITGYTFGATDQLVVGAELGSDDIESYTLYKQVITSVSASADKTSVPADGTPAKVTVTVKDQEGNPIAGALVSPSSGDAVAVNATTDANGQATFNQATGSVRFHANATGSTAYEPALGDKQSDAITVTPYVAKAASLSATSSDGAAFDFSEFSGGDLFVQVKDSEGNNFDTTNQSLQYRWVLTPFDGSAVQYIPGGTAAAPTSTTQSTETGGKFVLPFAATTPGTYELYGALTADAGGNNPVASSKLLTFKAGQAVIKLDQTSPVQADAGTSATVSGKVVLEDGTALVGRSVKVDYTTTGGNAAIVQEDNSTAASRTVKTDANGAFSVVIKDPAVATNQPLESGSVSADVVDGNWNGVAGNDGDAATTPATANVEFVKSTAAGTVVISNITNGTPGTPLSGTVTVRTADDPAVAGDQSVALSNKTVTLTVDEGFFTDGTADPKAAKGNDAGEYKSLGKSIPVTTNDQGVATFSTSIEDNAGFNDDGKVKATVTAAVNGVSDTEDVDWSTDNPLNGGEVRIELAPDALQQSAILPKAPLSDTVVFDVFVEDQFGNLVGGKTVNLSDDMVAGTVSSATATSDFAADGDFTASSTAAGNMKITASWTTSTSKYNDAATPAAVAGTETLTDDYTVEYYAVDYAASTYTLGHSGADNQPVNSTVTETYKAVDQNGEPVTGLDVTFYRAGPDDLQDGDGNSIRTTGQSGIATYVFQGAKAGTATVTAIANKPDGTNTGINGELIPEAQRTDKVTFGDDTPPPPVAINVGLSGPNNGAKRDALRVTTTPAAGGAQALLYKRANGGRVLVATKNLWSTGKTTFRVRDRNKNRFTKYIVVVRGTETTKQGRATTRVR